LGSATLGLGERQSRRTDKPAASMRIGFRRITAPVAKGDFHQTVMLTCRVQPDTLERLNQAAGKRSRSQELERRLRRTFTEDDSVGDPETAALLEYLSTVIRTVTHIKKPDARWHNDGYLYEQVRQALNDGLELFRPEGAPLTEDEIAEAGGRAQGRVAAREVVREMQLADPSVSMAKRSTSEHVLVTIRERLGPIAERLRPWGRSAEEERALRTIGRELNPLKIKRNLAATGKGPPLTEAEIARIDALESRIYELQTEHNNERTKKS
jgi:hypothetical protein